MTYVVDASLAAKWLVQEDDSELADILLESNFGAMHAPDLLLIEVGSAMVRRANERRIDRATAEDGIARLHRWAGPGIVLHRLMPGLTVTAARLAMAIGHPIADCVYLALADQLGCALATSDVKFRDRVGDPARVRLLAELV